MTMRIVSGVMSFFSVAAISLNTSLLPLIAFKSGRDIGSYKVLLFLYTLIAVIYTTVTLIMVPVFEPSEKGWLFYATVQYVPQELGSYLICLFSTCYIKLLLILTYSFLYRYCVICAPENLRWFQKKSYIAILVAIYFAVLFLCAGPVVKIMRLNKEIAENFANITYGSVNIELNKVSYIGAPMFRNGNLVPETVFILSIWTLVIMTSSSISMLCIIKIIGVLRSSSTLTASGKKFNRIQKRLFVLLILQVIFSNIKEHLVQTMVPLIFTFIPCLLSYGLAFLGTHAPIISQTSSALMPVAQVIDPLLIFAFIREYRRGLLDACRCVFHGPSTSPTVTNLSGTRVSSQITDRRFEVL